MRRKAFTLIEILLVCSIFATLSIAIFTCLSNGITLWHRANQLVTEEDVGLFFDRFSSDLRNTFNYSKFVFTGDEFKTDFPTVVWTSADHVSVRAGEGVVDQLGRVQYVYDTGRGVVLRRQANYSQALQDAWGGEEIVLPMVKGVSFHYFYSSSRDPRMVVEPGDGIPAGVEIDIVLPGAAPGSEDTVFRRYMPVPVGV